MNVMVNVLEKHQTSMQLTCGEDGAKKTTSVFITHGNTDSFSPDEVTQCTDEASNSLLISNPYIQAVWK